MLESPLPYPRRRFPAPPFCFGVIPFPGITPSFYDAIVSRYAVCQPQAPDE